MRFELYTFTHNRRNYDTYTVYQQANAVEILQNPRFNSSLPTVLYIHGLNESPTEISVQIVINAYLTRRGYNVILLNWQTLADQFYPVSVFNVARVRLYIYKTHGPQTLYIYIYLIYFSSRIVGNTVGHRTEQHVFGWTLRRHLSSGWTFARRANVRLHRTQYSIDDQPANHSPKDFWFGSRWTALLSGSRDNAYPGFGCFVCGYYSYGCWISGCSRINGNCGLLAERRKPTSAGMP